MNLNKQTDKADLLKKIAKYEEQLSWLNKMTKETEDNLFCAKADLQGSAEPDQDWVKMNDSITQNKDITKLKNVWEEKSMWEHKTKTYLQETKSLDKWKEKK